MKFRYQIVYRLGLVLLLVTTCWSVWANAQPAETTNRPPAVVGNVTSTNQFQALTFGLDKIPILTQHAFLEEPLWKYAASLLYIFLAFAVAWLLDYIVNVWLKRLAAKTETQADDLLLELLRGPVKVVAFVIFLNIGLGMFNWPLRAQLLLSRGLIVVVACSITYVAVKLIDLLLELWRQKIVSAEDRVLAEQLFPLARKVIKIGVIIVAAMLTADNLEIKITSLLAGLSIGGLALGLAAQDTVANLFGAVAIFLDKPFHLGDLVKVEGVDGTVESIGLRSTRIRNSDGHHVTIPNKTMGNAIITNVTRRPAIRTEMNLGLTYDTPVEKVKRATTILEEVFRSNAKTADLIISFNKFTDSALNIFVVHVWSGTDAKAHFADMQALNLQIKQRFDAEKIEFAFPTQTVHLKTSNS
jgi:MscS family membrane protein